VACVVVVDYMYITDHYYITLYFQLTIIYFKNLKKYYRMVMVFNTTFNTISVISIKHCVLKFVSDLQHVCQWFSPDTPVSSTNKTDRHKILLKGALNPITHPHTLSFDHCIVCPSNCSFIIETTQKYSINIDTTFKLLHKIYSHIYTEDHIKITYHYMLVFLLM
jgi:hypothetical protein